MKRRTIYEAEWVIEINAPPDGRDFDPHRDVKYGTKDFDDEALAAQYAMAHDLNGEGHVSEYAIRIVDGLPLRDYVDSVAAYDVRMPMIKQVSK